MFSHSALWRGALTSACRFGFGARSYSTNLPFSAIPAEDNLQNVLDGTKGNFNIVSVSDYLYKQKGPIVKTGPEVMGRDYVWVMSESGLLDISKSEDLTPDGSGPVFVPIAKYNEEKLDYKLWPFSPGEIWRERRMVAQKHLFSNQDAASHIKAINPVTKRIGDCFLEKMKKPMDETMVTQHTTFEYIYGIMFGMNPGLFDGTSTKAEDVFLHSAIDFFRLGFYEIFQDPEEYRKLEEEGTSEKYEEFCHVMEGIIEYGVGISRIIIEKIKNGTADELMRNSYVARQYLDNPDIDVKELSVNSAVLLTAGVDTTSCLIRMMMTKLAEYPEYQDDMVEEINRIAGGKSFEFKDREKFLVVKSFLRELHRLTPVGGGFMRRFKYPVTVDGYDVPSSTFLICMPTRNQNVAEAWEDFEEFNPRRWYPMSQGRKNVDKELSQKWTSANVATFGRGSHMCVGSRVAQAEILSFFCEILPRFKLSATW
eukprot:CAMPEP_0201485858 /NCGR_PEP_ID=MMETSP0151_2-20130828/9952_1 /ASSEMBLY_ACC=CAM_ASM_000257 /TAXON_ID=200890 /ORGANISM="Paramoeba atlantica, Strain 621/1 / CCAP 1560/9" /LENGTH=481 /DNA_ID=CAMNT_0047870185 /DNA_START=56 /DNA_END=1498 /DNA_ORIENTATION=+